MSANVLICDDAQFMRALIRNVLTDNGFTVVGEAETGAQAIEKYFELKPDLITMDVMMPVMTGLDALRQIMERDPAARVMICSAVGQKAMIDDALEAGARGFVVKPFTPPNLLEAVAQALGESQSATPAG